MTKLQKIILAWLAAAFAVGVVTTLSLGVSRYWIGVCNGVTSASFIGLIARLLARWARSPVGAFRRAPKQLGPGKVDRLNAHDISPEIRRPVSFVDATTEDLMDRHDHNRLKEADLAHQLRTVLQLLGARMDRLETLVTDEGVATFTKAKADIARMHDILAEQLDNATTGATAPPVEINVRDVVMERLNAWSDLAARRGSLTLRSVTIDSATIVTKRGTLEHLLDILLDNAIKHSPDHREILVSAQVSPAGEQVTIRVVDQGPGMIATQREYAFERGWQAKPGVGPGRGLGLSIAKMLVKSNRGRLTLSTAPSGDGLEVCVHFPVVLDRRPNGNTPDANGVIRHPESDSV